MVSLKPYSRPGDFPRPTGRSAGPSGGRRRPGLAPPATFCGSPGAPEQAVHPLLIKFLPTPRFRGPVGHGALV